MTLQEAGNKFVEKVMSMKLKELKDLGFDLSEHIKFTKTFRVRCSQCNVLVINGVPTHELTCINAIELNKNDEDSYYDNES